MASDLTRNHHQPHATGGGTNSNANINSSNEASTLPELLLQWGSRKRLRCVKLQHKDEAVPAHQPTASSPVATISAAAARADRALRRAASVACKQLLSSDGPADAVRSKRGVASPTREKGAGRSPERNGTQAAELAWPKLELVLTNKEKEEDYLAFKGSKLPQRPKKRTKPIQRTINLVCPGGWLCDLTIDRYEVREKKTTKKRPMGLKAMGNMESDSE